MTAANLDQLGDRVLVLEGPLARIIIALAAEFIPNVIGIDNPSAVRPHDKVLPLVKDFSVITNRDANGMNVISAATAGAIFSGAITNWSAVPDSGLTGQILALRLVDSAHLLKPLPATCSSLHSGRT